ncbi:MAG TPA: inner membrane-spanning protein YciB [Steroidobacteraceae bacterium]|nr:inner membrane-spanning protein YciB [Steroidobacteraceae bacterium]
MQALLEFAPLLAFIIAYYLGGLYTATAVLMVAMVALLAADYLLQRRIPPMHALSAVLVFVLGAATLLFHDKHFIQLKPTALFWLAGAAFLASYWIGERTLTERLLSAALQGQVQVSRGVWQRLNALWVVFYGAIGAANLAVAHYASERAWVNFKVFGLTIATLVFVGAQVIWLSRRAEEEPRAARVEEPPAA